MRCRWPGLPPGAAIAIMNRKEPRGITLISLNSYLDELGDQVCHVHEPVDLRHGVTALQYALEEAGRRPPVVIHQPRHADGRIDPIPVVTNLTASRQLVAQAMGMEDHRAFAKTYAKRSSQPVEPRIAGGAGITTPLRILKEKERLSVVLLEKSNVNSSPAEIVPLLSASW